VKNIMFWLKICLVGLMWVAGIFFYQSLPDILPTHWNMAGEVDGYGSKEIFVWLFPAIGLAMLILFWLLPKLDPRKEKYQKFAQVWEIMQTVLVGFFTYMYAVTLYAAMVPNVNVSVFVLVGIGVMFLILGNYMGKIRQNYFVGVKTPWTIDNEDVWNKTHRLAGWCFVLAGLLFIFQGLTGWVSGWLFGLAMVLAVVVPIIYSFVIFPKKK